MHAETAMPKAPHPALLRAYRYRLPLRRPFEHAMISREASEGVLVRIRLADGSEGIGEGVPRPYVTGETVNSAIEAIRDVYAERLASDEPLAEGPAAGSAMTVRHNAAWCACELAYLDAAARSAETNLALYLGRMLGRPVSRSVKLRVAGVVGTESAVTIRRSLTKMRLYGLRDFKLKVGVPGDQENLRVCSGRLRSGLLKGKITLRADANGAWSLDQARDACRWMKPLHVAALEQPLRKGDEADLPLLREAAEVPIMLDESLVDLPGAERLAEAGAADYWNLRISKNGGVLQTLRLADLARERGIGLMLGAMVGESGILSAAAQAVLQLAPPVRFLENSYGSFLVSEDLVRERTRFRFGGRLRMVWGPGLGVTLDEAVLERLGEPMLRIDLS